MLYITEKEDQFGIWLKTKSGTEIYLDKTAGKNKSECLIAVWQDFEFDGKFAFPFSKKFLIQLKKGLTILKQQVGNGKTTTNTVNY